MPESELSRPLRIFLCHSSGDKTTVRELRQRLRADGFEPWLDEENLLPGQDWQREIPKAVGSSDIVIVCLSHSSVNKAGYVQKEIKFALDVAEEQSEGTIFLIPLRLESCEVPDRLKRWQWCNLFEVDGYEHLKRSLEVRATQIADKETLTRKLKQPTTVGVKEVYAPLEQPYRLIKVVIGRSGDSTLDATRVSEIHHLLASYPGLDHFCFLIKARGETLQLDFPDDTTTIDEIMIDRLKSIHGVESVQISMSL
jgi:hypothetical protein